MNLKFDKFNKFIFNKCIDFCTLGKLSIVIFSFWMCYMLVACCWNIVGTTVEIFSWDKVFAGSKIIIGFTGKRDFQFLFQLVIKMSKLWDEWTTKIWSLKSSGILKI